MPFQDVPGNPGIKKILKRALVRGRVPNSLLFCGPPGVGKRRLAVELAKALNCLERTDDACGACPNCRAVDEEAMPDVLVIAPEKTVLTIGQIRELKETAYFKPMLGRARVFILDEADRMQEPAMNALLKVLEEPPLATHIFLVSDNPGLLLPTIRSRCQTLSFRAVSDSDVGEALRNAGVEGEPARIIPLLVRGNLERAMALDWEDVRAARRRAWDLFRAILTRTDASAFLRLYAHQRKADVKEDFAETIGFFASFSRDLLLLREGGDPGHLLNPDFEPEYRSAGALPEPGEAVRTAGALEAALAGLDQSLNMGLLSTSLYCQLTG